jgi:hypothetical protein
MPTQTSAGMQAEFHRRWGHLHDPHVRALAWLLDAPDMLDPAAPLWQDRIATLPEGAAEDAAEWLAALDGAPSALHDWLDVQPFSRLGRYAEKLMSFYFRHTGDLAAQGLQVQAAGNGTIGEFDFLLWRKNEKKELVHWEFATKFYLMQSAGSAARLHESCGADYFVGPNLADTLGAKMHKILNRQLALGSHPAAQAVLPQPVAAARALIKGWLFYHEYDPELLKSAGVASDHCRGFWCALGELENRQAHATRRYAVLQRLDWLAPARVALSGALDHAGRIADTS